MASNVLNHGDEAASSLPIGSAPLSVSPLPANDAKRRSTGACGNARRPRLEELLRIESSSNPLETEFNAAEPADMMAHGFLSEDDDFSEESGRGGRDGAIVVFDFLENEKSRDDDKEYVLLTPCNEEQQTVGNMAPLAYLDNIIGSDKPTPPEACGGAAGHVVPLTVLINMKRIGVLVAALRGHSRALKGSYWRQAAGRRATDGHAELFYHRPIALGRRCRVQHQPE